MPTANRSLTAAIAVILPCLGVASALPARAGAPRPAARAPSAGKAQAPADIEITLGRGGAEVAVTFRGAGDGVEISLSGVNGLALDPDGVVLADAAVAAGEVHRYSIRFTSKPATGDLAVFVRGRFNGLVRHRVASQRVAPASMMGARKPAPHIGPEGRPEVILPATRR